MNILHIALNDLKLTLKNKISLVLVIIMPLLMISLMGYTLRPLFLDQTEMPVNSNNQVDYVELQNISDTAVQSVSSFQFFAASMLIFFILTTGMGIGSSIINERKNKLYKRISSFSITNKEYLLGKILGNSIIGIIQAITIILFSKYTFDTDWGDNLVGITVVVLLLIFNSLALGVLFSSLVNSEKALTATMVVFIWFMTFISGGFTVTQLLSPLSNFTINKVAFDSLINLMTSSPFLDNLNNMVILTFIGFSLWLIGLRLYNRRVSYE